MGSFTNLLAILTTIYGVIGAMSSLLQVRRMLRTRSSDDVSLAFLLVYCGGYLMWLVYGLAVSSLPLIIVDVAGLLISAGTLSFTINLRMVEHGQTFFESLRDDAGRQPHRLEWLVAPAQRPARRVPSSLRAVHSNRHWPLYLLPLNAEADRGSLPSGLPGNLDQLLVQTASCWRAFDARQPDLSIWRECLDNSVKTLAHDWEHHPALASCRSELARPADAPPAAARLRAARTVTLAAGAHELISHAP